MPNPVVHIATCVEFIISAKAILTVTHHINFVVMKLAYS